MIKLILYPVLIVFLLLVLVFFLTDEPINVRFLYGFF